MKLGKSLISSVSGGFAILSGYGFIALSILIVTEVVARKLFGVSLQSVDEISGYVLAVISPFAFAYALMVNAHTRIDILYGNLSGGKRRLLDVLAYLAIAGVAGFMIWTVWKVLVGSWKYGTVSIGILSIPLWIPQVFWFVGSIVFFSVALFLVVKALRITSGPISADEDPKPPQNDTL